MNIERQKEYAVRVNIFGILAFAFFWNYGLFGALTGGLGAVWNALLAVLLLGIFVFFTFHAEKGTYVKTFIFRKEDAWSAVLFVAGMVLLSWNALLRPMVGDAFSHAGGSELPGIKIVQTLAGYMPAWFGNAAYADAIVFVNIAIAAGAYMFWKLGKKGSAWTRVVAWGSVFLAARSAVILLGGSEGTHPPLRFVPLWLGGTIFGMTSLGFRLAAFAALLGIMFVVYRYARAYAGKTGARLAAFAVGTIPVLWHAGVIVEQSVWAALFWAALLLSFSEKDEDKKENAFFWWFALLSITSLMRQSAMGAIVPLGIWYAAHCWKTKERDIKRIMMTLAPILLMVPFAAKSLLYGTTASYVPEAGGLDIPHADIGIMRVWYAIRTGIVWNAIENSVFLPWVVAAAAGAILFSRDLRRGAGIVSLMAVSAYMFYSIHPGLWGIGRYQAEYVAPLAVLGLALIGRECARRGRWGRGCFASLAALLIIFNIRTFRDLPRLNIPAEDLKVSFSEIIKKRGEYHVLSEIPHPYRDAMKEAKKGGYAGSVYVAGVTYGVFPQIQYRWSIEETEKEKAIYDFVEKGGNRARGIDKDKRIRLVMISDLAEGDALRRELEGLGWKVWKITEDREYGSKIEMLVRNKDI